MADAEEGGKEGESKEGGEEVRWSEGGKREERIVERWESGLN